jgi:hypothetical protein
MARKARAGRARAITLPGVQQWTLWHMEKSLLAEEPRLDSLFTIFTRTARNDAMPLTERYRPGRYRE